MPSLLTVHITDSSDLGSQFASFLNLPLGLSYEGMAVEEGKRWCSCCLYGTLSGRAHVCRVIISSNTLREGTEQVKQRVSE